MFHPWDHHLEPQHWSYLKTADGFLTVPDEVEQVKYGAKIDNLFQDISFTSNNPWHYTQVTVIPQLSLSSVTILQYVVFSIPYAYKIGPKTDIHMKNVQIFIAVPSVLNNSAVSGLH